MKPYQYVLCALAFFLLYSATCKNTTQYPLGGRIDKPGEYLLLDTLAANLQKELDGKVVKYAFVLRHGLYKVSRVAGKRRTAADPPEQDFTLNNRYNLASVSKTITAIAILQLLEKKNLSVNSNISNYLPTTWTIPGSFQRITFAELLSHTAGIRNDFGNLNADVKQTVQMGIDTNLIGTYKYLNVNFAICRILVAYMDGYAPPTPTAEPDELAVSTRFRDYLQKNIFDPLSIKDVKFAPPMNFATLFYRFPAGSAHGYDLGDCTLTAGPSGIQLSTNELSDFLFQLDASTLLLSANMKKHMNDHLLGWDTMRQMNGDSLWTKNGWLPIDTVSSYIWTAIMQFKNGLEVTLMYNGDPFVYIPIDNAYKKSWVKTSP